MAPSRVSPGAPRIPAPWGPTAPCRPRRPRRPQRPSWVLRAAGVGRAGCAPRPGLCDVRAGTWNPGSGSEGWEAAPERVRGGLSRARGAAMSGSNASALPPGEPSRQPLFHQGRRRRPVFSLLPTCPASAESRPFLLLLSHTRECGAYSSPSTLGPDGAALPKVAPEWETRGQWVCVLITARGIRGQALKNFICYRKRL